MSILYDLAFIAFALIYLPYAFFRKKVHRGFIQRLGFLPAGLPPKRPIWVHAVSVGESRVAGILIDRLRQQWPQE